MSSTDMYLVRSSDIATRTLGDDTIIISTLDSSVFMLNAVGTVIWNAADGHTPLSHIVRDRVCCEFDVSDEEAYADARELAGRLAEHGVLQISDIPVSPNEAL